MPKSRRGRICAAGAISVLATELVAPPAPAALTGASGPTRTPLPDRVTDASQRPSGWQKSSDRIVTYVGGGTGRHTLVADAANTADAADAAVTADAYRWRTAATLSEPGIGTDQWIGQSCVTASGDRAAEVYTPRQVINEQQGFQQGGFAAVANPVDGTVTKLPQLLPLAYGHGPPARPRGRHRPGRVPHRSR